MKGLFEQRTNVATKAGKLSVMDILDAHNGKPC